MIRFSLKEVQKKHKGTEVPDSAAQAGGVVI